MATCKNCGNTCGSQGKCGCNDTVLHLPPNCNPPACPNPEPCPETFSDCCIIHNGDSFTYLFPQAPNVAEAVGGGVNVGPIAETKNFTILQGERLCDTWQRFISFYYCINSVLEGGLEIPYGLKSKAITSTSITIGWTPTTNATSYDVYYAPASTSIFVNAGNVLQNSNPTFTITGLNANTTYYVYVVSNYSSGDFGQTSCPSVSLILTTKVS